MRIENPDVTRENSSGLARNAEALLALAVGEAEVGRPPLLSPSLNHIAENVWPLLTNSAAMTRPVAGPQLRSARRRRSAGFVDEAEKVAPFFSSRWKSMSLAKISASWVATPSGIPASSVAMKSEERTVPLAITACAASGTVVVSATMRLSAMRWMRRRVNWVGSFSALGAA